MEDLPEPSLTELKKYMGVRFVKPRCIQKYGITFDLQRQEDRGQKLKVRA